MMRRLLMAAAVLFLCVGQSLAAWEPGEALDDPALESRARSISSELRCMVCQNQSIDDSDAELARDLRLIVRERLIAGDSDEQVYDFVVARYGEFVLLRPRLNTRTALLWGLPALLFVGGGYIAWRQFQGRRSPRTAPLSEQEEKQLAELLDRTD